MSLNQILNELQEGVENTAIENLAVLEKPVLQEQDLAASYFKIEASTLDKSIVKKINNLYDLGIIKSTIGNTSKVDYNVAQEVFTMLPETSVADRAKVTAAPSIINKEILDNVLKTQTGEYSMISYQLKVDIDKIIEDISNNLVHILEVQQYINSFLESVKNDAIRLEKNPPIVIANTNSYNLFTFPIYEVYNKVYGYELHYAKYQSGLLNQYSDIASDDTFKKFIPTVTTKYTIETISLSDFIILVQNVADAIKNKISELENRVDKYKAIKAHIDKEITQELVSTVNSTEFIYQDLLYFKCLHDIKNTDNNVFDKVLALTKFLD